jgi:hypothetical protein
MPDLGMLRDMITDGLLSGHKRAIDIRWTLGKENTVYIYDDDLLYDSGIYGY